MSGVVAIFSSCQLSRHRPNPNEMHIREFMERVASAPNSGLHNGLGVPFRSFERRASNLATGFQTRE